MRPGLFLAALLAFCFPGGGCAKRDLRKDAVALVLGERPGQPDLARAMAQDGRTPSCSAAESGAKVVVTCRTLPEKPGYRFEVDVERGEVSPLDDASKKLVERAR